MKPKTKSKSDKVVIPYDYSWPGNVEHVKWEYTTEVTCLSWLSMKILNYNGVNGWELVSVTTAIDSKDKFHTTAYFKRRAK